MYMLYKLYIFTLYIGRFEAFNSHIRARNIYGNKSAPSTDIANHFSIIEQLRHLCEDGYVHGAIK